MSIQSDDTILSNLLLSQTLEKLRRFQAAYCLGSLMGLHPGNRRGLDSQLTHRFSHFNATQLNIHKSSNGSIVFDELDVGLSSSLVTERKGVGT